MTELGALSPTSIQPHPNRDLGFLQNPNRPRYFDLNLLRNRSKVHFKSQLQKTFHITSKNQIQSQLPLHSPYIPISNIQFLNLKLYQFYQSKSFSPIQIDLIQQKHSHEKPNLARPNLKGVQSLSGAIEQYIFWAILDHIWTIFGNDQTMFIVKIPEIDC